MALLAILLGGSDSQQRRAAAGRPGRQGGCRSQPSRGGRDVGGRQGRVAGRDSIVRADAADADLFVVADTTGALHLSQPTRPVSRRSADDHRQDRSVGELRMTGVKADPLPGGGGRTTRRIIDAGRIMLAAAILGAGTAMIEQAVAYAGTRVQFGRPIGSFQAVKHMCAEMAAALEPCRSLVWYAAHAFDHAPDESTLMACHAKSHLSEVGRFVARTSTEVHGGMGFTDLAGCTTGSSASV